MTTAVKVSKRKYIRFRADLESVAYVSFESVSKKETLKIKIACLIIDEAPRGGCCLICFNHEKLILNKEYLVTVGNLSPLRAQLVWMQSYGDDMVKLGFQFEE